MFTSVYGFNATMVNSRTKPLISVSTHSYYRILNLEIVHRAQGLNSHKSLKTIYFIVVQVHWSEFFVLILIIVVCYVDEILKMFFIFNVQSVYILERNSAFF